MAGRLGNAHRARHGRAEDELAEVPTHLVRDVRREPGPAVDHRQDHAADREPRVQPRADELDRADQLRQPLERVVLGLHRDEHAVRGRQRVDGQRAEGGRAVDEDEPVGLAGLREAFGQVTLAVRPARELDRGARQFRLRRHQLQVLETRRSDQPLELDPVEQVE